MLLLLIVIFVIAVPTCSQTMDIDILIYTDSISVCCVPSSSKFNVSEGAKSKYKKKKKTLCDSA